jgi:hypothetical protein
MFGVYVSIISLAITIFVSAMTLVAKLSSLGARLETRLGDVCDRLAKVEAVNDRHAGLDGRVDRLDRDLRELRDAFEAFAAEARGAIGPLGERVGVLWASVMAARSSGRP